MESGRPLTPSKCSALTNVESVISAKLIFDFRASHPLCLAPDCRFASLRGGTTKQSSVKAIWERLVSSRESIPLRNLVRILTAFTLDCFVPRNDAKRAWVRSPDKFVSNKTSFFHNVSLKSTKSIHLFHYWTKGIIIVDSHSNVITTKTRF